MPVASLYEPSEENGLEKGLEDLGLKDKVELVVKNANDDASNANMMVSQFVNDGVDLTTGKRFTKGYGYFKDMKSYEELLSAWDKTVREMTRYSVIVENAIDKASERDVPAYLRKQAN